MNSIQILHHTHWDREWYESFSTYQMKLRKGVLQILEHIDNKTIETFFFDGQTVILEDLEKVLNEKEYMKFITYIKQGIIEVGPWYVLSDGFLCDGESYFKNLEIGREIANQLNQDSRLGYFPDTFGHIGQLPQILKLMGMTKAFIHRGSVSKSYLNKWYGSDGTCIDTIVYPTREGYYQDLFHDEMEDFKSKLKKQLAILDEVKAPSYFIMDGCDHTFISKTYKEKKEYLEVNYPNQVKDISMQEYLNACNFDESGSIFGEQVNRHKAFVLHGTLSTRAYLKQQYYRNIHWMVNVLEPILTILGANETCAKASKMIWKQHLLNMGHDSICGCSIDSVHEEMEVRMLGVYDGIQGLLHQEMYSALPYTIHSLGKKQLYLYIFNPKVEAVSLRQVSIQIPKIEDTKTIKLYRDNKEIEIVVRNRVVEEKLYAEYDQAPQYKDVTVFDVSFYDEAHSVGIYTYTVVVVDNVRIETQPIEVMENTIYKMQVVGQKIQLYCKKKEQVIEDLLCIRHSYDEGDSYNYSKPEYDIVSDACLTQYEYKNFTQYQELHVDYTLQVRKGIKNNRKEVRDEVISMPIQVIIRMDKSEYLRLEIKYDNILEDCKIRIGFYLNSSYIYGNTAFDLVKREVKEKVYPKAKNAIENEWYTFTSLHSLYNDEKQIQISHDGSVEGEIDGEYVFLTLTRAVGDLSRRDIRSRDGGAGPSFACPQAQCLRSHRYEMVISYEQVKYDANLYKTLYPIYSWMSEVYKKYESLYTIDNPSIGISHVDSKGIRIYNEQMKEQKLTLNTYSTTMEGKKIRMIEWEEAENE